MSAMQYKDLKALQLRRQISTVEKQLEDLKKELEEVESPEFHISQLPPGAIPPTPEQIPTAPAFHVFRQQDPVQPVLDEPEPLRELGTRMFDDLESAQNALLEACEASGFAAARQRCSDKSPTTGDYTRITYACYKGGTVKRKERTNDPNVKTRNTASVKTGCPWSGCLKFSWREKTWRFSYVKQLCQHNHEMVDSIEASGIANNRRRARDQVKVDIEAAALNPKNSTGDIISQIQFKHPGLVLTKHDIRNYLTKVRKQQAQQALQPIDPALSPAQQPLPQIPTLQDDTPPHPEPEPEPEPQQEPSPDMQLQMVQDHELADEQHELTHEEHEIPEDPQTEALMQDVA